MSRGLDPKRDVPPTIDDPKLAALAERFMAGEVAVVNKRGARVEFDGFRDKVDARGRRRRSAAHRKGQLGGFTGATTPAISALGEEDER